MLNNNYNAREIMEAIKAAEEAMMKAQQSKVEAINYYKQQLVELGETNEATIVTNETIININKGKIVEVPVVKEVAVDNTNEEYIEQLLKDLENRNKRIEELKAQLEREQQLYRDLEFEANEEIDAVAEKRDKEIARLKEELAHKDLLLDEFREAMDEKVNRIHELEDKIDSMEYVHRGVVAGYEGQLQNKQLTIESLEKQIADAKEDKVRAEFIRNKNGETIEIVDDPLYNEPKEEVVEQVEEIIVPVTKEEKKQTTIASGLTFEIHKTHDAVKAKVTEGQKTFYVVWSVKDKAPAYSYVDKYNHYCRAKEWWRYDRLVKPELKALRDELIKELQDKKNKNNTRQSAPQITKEVVKETPEEITIPTNDTVESTNDVSAFDDMEFC